MDVLNEKFMYFGGKKSWNRYLRQMVSQQIGPVNSFANEQLI